MSETCAAFQCNFRDRLTISQTQGRIVSKRALADTTTQVQANGSLLTTLARLQLKLSSCP